MDTIIEAKGLAYILCRELLEDIHVLYQIPDSEIEKINKRSVNRAAILLDLMENNPRAYAAYVILTERFFCQGWDDPEEDEDIKEMLECLESEEFMKYMR